MTKSLVIGATGLIGMSLFTHLGDDVEGTKYSDTSFEFPYLDIVDKDAVHAVLKQYKPEVVYLAAGISNVSKCDDDTTDKVNVEGTINVINTCSEFHAKIVYFSSSYVFDGKSEWPYAPNQELSPINGFGEQKGIVEKNLEFSTVDYLIIRSIGVFGFDFKNRNFAAQVLANAQNSAFSKVQRKLFVPNDQFMNPIHVDHLAEIVVKLVSQNVKGIVHVAGDTCRNKYEFAKDILDAAGTKLNVLEGVPSDTVSQFANRPKMGCLDCSDLYRYGITTPSYQEGIKKLFD